MTPYPIGANNVHNFSNFRIVHAVRKYFNSENFTIYCVWQTSPLFQDIMDPNKHFIKDDTIILQAKVEADAPHGIKLAPTHSSVYSCIVEPPLVDPPI